MRTTKQSLPVFATVIFLLMAGNSFCQKKNFGIKGGLNFSNILDNNTEYFIKPESKLGFQVYLSYDFFNSRSFVLSGETGFDQKGYSYEVTETNEEGEVTNSGYNKVNLNYLDISFNAKYIIRGKSAAPYFSLAPNLGISLGGSSNTVSDEEAMFAEYDKSIYDSLNSVSFGVKVGLGIEIYSLIKNIPLLFEVRYNPDFTQAYNNHGIEFRNADIEFNTGIKF